MKTFTCIGTCGGTYEIPDTAKRPNFCKPCRAIRIRQHMKTGAEKRKALALSANGGEPVKCGNGASIRRRLDEIALRTRQETAALLGVSQEQIRQDELNIIAKIRSACGELAAECGFKVAGIHTFRRAHGH